MEQEIENKLSYWSSALRHEERKLLLQQKKVDEIRQKLRYLNQLKKVMRIT